MNKGQVNKELVNIVLFEDEFHAEERLTELIQELRPNYQIMATFDSVEEGVEYFKSAPKTDLIFMDIQLADGLSLDIFNQVSIKSPVIFTTAFDQYAIKAFKVYSVDYLLKPIDKEELKNAIERFETNYHNVSAQVSEEDLKALAQQFITPTTSEKRKRFLVKKGISYITVQNEEVAYLYSEDGLTILRSKFGKKYIIDQSLDHLMEEVPTDTFYRINRKVILNHQAIQKMKPWVNHRLKIDLEPNPHFDVIVSRDRVKDFKKWLDK